MTIAFAVAPQPPFRTTHRERTVVTHLLAVFSSFVRTKSSTYNIYTSSVPIPSSLSRASAGLWSLAEEEHGPVCRLPLRSIGQHEVSKKTDSKRSVSHQAYIWFSGTRTRYINCALRSLVSKAEVADVVLHSIDTAGKIS